MRIGAFSLAGLAGRVANLPEVFQATSRSARAGVLARCCGLLAVLAAFLPAVATAEADPPSAAAFERATGRVLERAAFATAPGDVLRAPEPEAPEGVVFPDDLYVTLYGAPQLVNTELGVRTPREAGREAARLAGAYEREGASDAVPGFDLIGVVANSTPGPDRKYRTRQPDELIATYLQQAREAGGRLMLDIQPGRSSAVREIGALEEWFAEPDVDAGIDPEWNVGRKGVPGETTGRISAGEINTASRLLARIIRREDLPPKVLIVHQFTKQMIRSRGAIRQRDEVQVALNFDGIGSPAAKEAGYELLATRGLFNGFSIFLRLDTTVMRPASILGLLPAVNFLLYQ